MLHGFTIRQ